MKYLLLNTSDAYTTTPHDCSFSIDGSKNLQGISKIALQTAIIPNLRYPINESNNTLNFSENGFSSVNTITLAQGNYTPNTLAAELEAKLNDSSDNDYSVSYSGVSQKLTITTLAPDSIKIIESGSTSLEVLGFTEESLHKQVVEATYSIRLDGTQFLDILINVPSDNIVSSNIRVFKRIPVGSGYGSLVVYETSTPDFTYLKTDGFNTLDISIRDDRGRQFVLPNNARVQYTFKLE